ARARLQERILLDHGMTVDPDLITVHTISVEIDPGVGIDIDYEYVGPSELEPHYETQERSLTE
ncbi:hypothetical protein, partial [Pseudomonas syringae]|uniref:hypothetical protein n=1 Tax=Pseudomonas syringae TaxID=317 RepID=UPI00404362D8